MKWTEPSIGNICSKSLIYYCEDQEKTCKRICKVLDIDQLPDIKRKSYWEQKSSGDWQEIEIGENLKVRSSTPVFDEAVIKAFQRSSSNILYSDDMGKVEGILHFTDYDCETVYNNLYNNYFVFESNLRNALTTLGYGNSDMVTYFQYKEQKEKKDNKKIFYTTKIEKALKAKAKMDGLLPFQTFDISDLINLFNNRNKVDKPYIMFDIPEEVKTLRNRIMHAKTFTGETELRPHNFKTFSTFFDEVQCFTKAFYDLRNLRASQILNSEKLRNLVYLKALSEYNDTEMKNNFYGKQ